MHCRRNVLSAKMTVGETYCRQNELSAKRLSKCTVDEMNVGEMNVSRLNGMLLFCLLFLNNGYKISCTAPYPRSPQ